MDLSQCVHHEVAVSLLKSPKHHVLQNRCFSREIPHTHATENTSSVDPSLKLTSWVSQNLVVDLLLLIPPLVPSGQCVTFSCEPGYTINPRDAPSATSRLSCKENGFEPNAPVSSSPVMCNKPEFGNVERRLDVIKKFSDSCGFLSMLESSTLVRQVSQPLARHPVLRQYLLCVELREM